MSMRCEQCGRFARAAVSASSGLLVAACALCGNAPAVEHHVSHVVSVQSVAAVDPTSYWQSRPGLGAHTADIYDEPLHVGSDYEFVHVANAEYSGTASTVQAPWIQHVRPAVRPRTFPVPRARAFGPPPTMTLPPVQSVRVARPPARLTSRVRMANPPWPSVATEEEPPPASA